MKREERVDGAERLREILKLTTHSMYDRFTNSINLSLAKQNALKVYEINPTAEELGYVRAADGISLLHLAIFSHNPYLVALYVHLGVNPDFHKFENGVTPRSLISKTGHLVDGMRNAFFTPDDFLRDTGILKDFTVETYGRFEVQILHKDDDVEASKVEKAIDFLFEVPARPDTPGPTSEERHKVKKDFCTIASRSPSSCLDSFEELELTIPTTPEKSIFVHTEVPKRPDGPVPSLEEQEESMQGFLDLIYGKDTDCAASVVSSSAEYLCTNLGGEDPSLDSV